MTRRALKRRPGRQRGSGSSKGRGGAATRRCLKRRPVLDLGIPSRESIVDPRKQSVSKGPSRRGRGGSQPYNGLLRRGSHRGELSSPG